MGKTSWHQRKYGLFVQIFFYLFKLPLSHYCCALSLARLNLDLSFYVVGGWPLLVSYLGQRISRASVPRRSSCPLSLPGAAAPIYLSYFLLSLSSYSPEDLYIYTTCCSPVDLFIYTTSYSEFESEECRKIETFSKRRWLILTMKNQD
jgi:hypothetical protein